MYDALFIASVGNSATVVVIPDGKLLRTIEGTDFGYRGHPLADGGSSYLLTDRG